MPSDPIDSYVPDDDAPARDTANDPYAIWQGRERQRIPYEEVREGVASFLKTFYQSIWYALTPYRHPFYLAREEGLHAWCRYEAGCRLDRSYQETYSLTEFAELAFREDLHRSGRKSLADPFWAPLILLKLQEADVEFFRRLSVLVNQPEVSLHNGMRRLALGWDRESIPLSFWSYPAIARRIRWEEGREVAGENTLKQWAHRLGLKQQIPLIITGYNKAGQPLIDEAAFEYHKIPDLP